MSRLYFGCAIVMLFIVPLTTRADCPSQSRWEQGNDCLFGEQAPKGRCFLVEGVATYVLQPVEGMTGKTIAEHFITTNSGYPIDSETLPVLRAMIVAFEGERQSAMNAAKLIAGNWDDWRAHHMKREEFISKFVLEANARKSHGTPAYAAVLQSAQAMRNQLDNMHGSPGLRPAPDNSGQLWIWDAFIRRRAADAAIQALAVMPGGTEWTDEYLLKRRKMIKDVCLRH